MAARSIPVSILMETIDDEILVLDLRDRGDRCRHPDQYRAERGLRPFVGVVGIIERGRVGA